MTTITRKQSQRRYFHKSACDCRDCLGQDRRVSVWIVVASLIVVLAFVGSYLVVRLFA